jgi:hypothetical protein
VYVLLPVPAGSSLSWMPPSSLYCCHRSASSSSAAASRSRQSGAVIDEHRSRKEGCSMHNSSNSPVVSRPRRATTIARSPTARSRRSIHCQDAGRGGSFPVREAHPSTGLLCRWRADRLPRRPGNLSARRLDGACSHGRDDAKVNWGEGVGEIAATGRWRTRDRPGLDPLGAASVIASQTPQHPAISGPIPTSRRASEALQIGDRRRSSSPNVEPRALSSRQDAHSPMSAVQEH